MVGKVEELLVILLIILVLFGGKKIPQLARAIGQSVREVREGIRGGEPEKNKESEKVEV